MKILINNCYGGFHFSEEFAQEYINRTGVDIDLYSYDLRSDAMIISLFEEFGSERSSGGYSRLKLIEIPDDVEYTVEEYDGIEWIAEVHRTWS